MNESWSLQTKKDCLLEEYKQLSALTTQDAIASGRTKGWCIAAWSISLGFALQARIEQNVAYPALSVIVVLFWWLNAFFGFYAQFHLSRLNVVRNLLDHLQTAGPGTMRLAAWRSPVDPFESASKLTKLRAVARSFMSFPLVATYGALLIVTFAVFHHVL